jgi:hypothetical protein
MGGSNRSGDQVDPLPVDGWFAATDPDDRGRMTFWRVERGRMHSYPGDVRWPPSPPRFEAESKAERALLRDDWYAEVYWPWKRAVRDAIVADPDGASRAFRARYPAASTVLETRRTAREALRAERVRLARFEAVWAAAMARRGVATAAIARRQGVAWSTARTRIAEGELMLRDDLDGARVLLAEGRRGLFVAPGEADRMAVAVLAGSADLSVRLLVEAAQRGVTLGRGVADA